MSIIFQTLNTLKAAPADEKPPVQALEDRQRSVPGPRRDQMRKKWLATGLVAGALVVLGFALVFGVKYLAEQAGMPKAEAAAVQPLDAVANGPAVEPKAQGNSQPIIAAPRYVPPAEPRQSPDQAALDVESLSARPMEKTGHLSPSLSLQAPGGANTEQAVEMAGLDRPPAPPAENPADVPALAAQGDDPVVQPGALSAERSRPPAIPEPLTAEQRQAEKAREAARAKNARIEQLVARLEIAMAGPVLDSGRIDAQLAELSQLKAPGSPYVDKLRAYWLLKQEKFDQAKVLLEKMAAANDEDAEVGINLAVIEFRTGNTPAAVSRLQRLRKAHPDNVQIADLIRRLQ